MIFPKTCLSCGKEGSYICLGCLGKVDLLKPVCPYCERPSIDGATHTKCQKKYGLDGLISIWEYEGVIRKAILALKYRYATEVGKELANRLAVSLSKVVIPKASHLIPIPIFWYRQNTRGFNQSVEIGRAVSVDLNIQFEPDLLIRKKPTVPQVELTGSARRKNLRGVFSVNSGYPLSVIPHSLFLFDDVFTTGSTLFEAAKTLKRAGVEKVWGLTIAR